MYIISGRIKGRRIECPPGVIRPMTAICRKALFDILGDLTGKKLLDLFSGSGAIALEAFSHGIESADMVEFDYNKKTVLSKNLINCGFPGARVNFTDALAYCERSSGKYDLITADPPFNYELKERLISTIDQRELLNKEGTLMIHLTSKETLPGEFNNLVLKDVRKYGINCLWFYENKK